MTVSVINNLANSPAHAATLKRLRGVLEKWIEDSNDQGRVFESAELVAHKGLTKTNGNPNIGYTLDGKPPGAADVRPKPFIERRQQRVVRNVRPARIYGAREGDSLPMLARALAPAQ